MHLLERAAVDLFQQIAHQLEDGEVEQRNGQERQQRRQHQRALDRAVAYNELQERVESDKGEDFQQHDDATAPQQPQALLGLVQHRAGCRHDPETTSSCCPLLVCVWRL